MKVLIVGYNHYGFVKAITTACASVDNVDAESLLHEYIPVRKTRSGNIFRRFKYRRKHNKMCTQIIEEIRQNKPNLVLFIEGSCISSELVNSVKSLNVKTALWCLDSLRRINLEQSQLEAYDDVFVFEQTDTDIFPEACYLPIGYTPDVYKKLDGVTKKYDICWVGSAHEERLKVLEKTARFCEEYGLSFGVFGQFFKQREQSQFDSSYPSLSRSLVRNERIAPEEANVIYNESRLAINIHTHAPKDEAYNPRTWEAMSAGAVMLTDWKPSFENVLTHGSDSLIYHDLNELKELLLSKFSDYNLDEIMRNGINLASTKHTFTERLKVLIDNCMVEEGRNV